MFANAGQAKMTRGSVVLVGGGGRVAPLVRQHWPDKPSLLVTSRNPVEANSLCWSPMQGPAGLLHHLEHRGLRPLALVMLAGVTPAKGQAPTALSANADIALACLTAAQMAGINRVLLASSSAVYGVDPQGHPFSETAPIAPVSAYGAAKLRMEEAAEPFRQAGLDICALRIGNVAGADALLHPLGPDRCREGAQVPRIDTFADGLGPLRSYIGPETLARVLSNLCTTPSPLPKVLNIAAPAPVRMEQLAVAAGWPFVTVPAPARAHQVITLDCSRLAQLCPMEEKDSDPATMVAQWKMALAQ